MTVESRRPADTTAGRLTIEATDGLRAEPGAIGRCAAATVRLSLRVDPGGGPRRVLLRLGWDEHTVRVWAEHNARSGLRNGGRTAELPRIVAVRVHGTIRAAAVLSAPRRRAPRLYSQVAFDACAADLAGGGPLEVELGDVTAHLCSPPGEPAERRTVAGSATVGLLVKRVTVAGPSEEPITPRSYERLSILSMGGLTAYEHKHDRPGPYRLRAGLLVVNPIRPEALRLRIRPVREPRGGDRHLAGGLLRAFAPGGLQAGPWWLGVPATGPDTGAPPWALPKSPPYAVGLAGGRPVAVEARTRRTYRELVVPSLGEPVLIRPCGGGEPGVVYRLMCCAPEPPPRLGGISKSQPFPHDG